MNVKKFEASTFEEALTRVKSELGPDALILATEEKKRGWFQKPSVEITAAFQAKVEHKEWDDGVLENIFPHRKGRPGVFADESEIELAGTRSKKGESKSAPSPAIHPQILHSATQESARFEKAFLTLGLSLETSKDFARQLAFDYSKKDRSDIGFLEKVKTKFLSTGVKTLGPEVFSTRREWAVVGNPGVGKTCFLVKLALVLKGLGHLPVLCSSDSRKLVARRELMAYAKLIDVVYSADQTFRRNNRQILLLDTPSTGPNQTELQKEVEKNCLATSTVVLLDASQRLSELMRTIEKWSRVAPVAIAFSKIDTVSDLGVLFEVLRASKLPLLGVSLAPSFGDAFRFLDPGSLARLIVKKPAEESAKRDIIQSAASNELAY
jgi:flagellar biosynthesis protein FlhF